MPYLTYTLTAHNTGPNAVTSATLTATLPPGKSATNLSAAAPWPRARSPVPTGRSPAEPA
ncbi:hypothetical protein ACFQX6_67220 [Streptosporangium lutulentum]